MVPPNSYSGKLVDYLKRNLKKGYPLESLKWALINQGHSNLQVEKAIKKAKEDLANKAPVLKTKPIIKREIFDHKNQRIVLHKSKKKSLLKKFF
jgi:hypothetical protein